MTEIVTPKCPCPLCGHELDRATPVEKGATPKAGDLSVCIGCGGCLTFAEDLTLRELSDAELNELPPDTRLELVWACRTVREINKHPRAQIGAK